MNHLIYQVRRRFRWIYQKIRYGWSGLDCWSLDVAMAKRIALALRVFISETRMGYPILLWTDKKNGDFDQTENELVWEAILWRMVDGFERIASDKFFGFDETEYDEATLELFANFYFSLWD